MAIKSPLINVMERAARKAGRGLLRDFGEVEQLQVTTKGPADFVSNADHKAERTIHDELKRVRPDFGFLMEESGEIPGTSDLYRWVVDPLDGTTNFLHGIPHFCISIGVEGRSVIGGKAMSEIVAGIVYDPVHDHSYWAEKGAGAYLNDRRLRVSGRRDLATSLLASGLPTLGRADPDVHQAQTRALMEKVAGIRRFGASALDLAWVAAGRFDAFWEVALSPWDIAAGILLVREAGGFVTEIDGGNNMMASGSLLASNGQIHAEVRHILANPA
jgi:myo-inositol-1(or 4)-monophosphatase